MQRPPRFYCGIDWADQVNDVAVIDRDGEVLARTRISAIPDGVRELFTLLDGLRASHTHGLRQVPVAIETNQGLLVHALRAKGQPVYQIPPSEVARQRQRTSRAAKKSDRSDAALLAIMLRDRWGLLRQLPGVSPDAAAITVLTHAQYRAQLLREQLQAQLRALLVQVHPVAAHGWDGRDHGLRRPEARAVLAAGPTAAAAQTVTAYRWEKVLTGVRLRLLEQEAYRLRDLFTAPVLRLPPAIEQATAVEVRALLAAFDHACDRADELTAVVTDAFDAHPQAKIYLSFPGCGALTGARLLAELGDDPARFATAKGLRAYAGLAPLTWASGTVRQVTHRRICNRRLKLVCHRWAFSALTRSPGARALYDRRRGRGDTYAGALRHVGGRLLSGLHRCLVTGTLYDEQVMFARPHAAG
ncbi:IS110 family transposase [Winogradskya humida]|uniref:Mini-circle putative transposase for IS117 n=1 Tax=Winogradskya humida TaxID=113566 RepID=A0ABQ4A1V0_9ACTN|nr:transposase [Actinoplanes humidus]GIE24823.1 mini-circle putative transposase for IS117 [Actinoplanes humidus]